MKSQLRMSGQLQLDLEKKYRELHGIDGTHIDTLLFISWVDREAREMPEFKERLAWANMEYEASLISKYRKNQH